MKQLQFLIFGLIIILVGGDVVLAQNSIPSVASQIKTAILPAPDQDKDGATVYGYDTDGNFKIIRKGTNSLICLADDPNKEGVSVSCYVNSLEPFMKRGRALKLAGKETMQIREIRAKEVEQGTLKMPSAPSMTYIYFGKQEDYSVETGALKNGKFRYVIYTPFATAKSTGLPEKPHAKGMPWIMDPGTHRAHIMIGPCN